VVLLVAIYEDCRFTVTSRRTRILEMHATLNSIAAG
jgi:hypothetical protein